jgi:deazaflavin-dependent oxidoreductase (nitroreductase family)
MTATPPPSSKDALQAFISDHRTRYIRSGGADGHIVDGRGSGAYLFGPTCLIRYKGRKSGKTFITPLSYAGIAGEVVIAGSKGGADLHPAWYLNLVAAKEVDFQIATQAFRASWHEPEGVERRKIWDFMADCYPFYRTYQSRTSRQIPLVMMKPIEAIPVFREDDMASMPF